MPKFLGAIPNSVITELFLRQSEEYTVLGPVRHSTMMKLDVLAHAIEVSIDGGYAKVHGVWLNSDTAFEDTTNETRNYELSNIHTDINEGTDFISTENLET